jgi:hypothetical protein
MVSPSATLIALPVKVWRNGELLRKGIGKEGCAFALKMIVSGGQTGAAIAGIDTPIAYKIPYGDWTPKGRLTEDGSLPEQYHLQETPTAQNVIDSDGTVVFTHGTLSGGSLLTRKKAVQHGKPVLHVDLAKLTNEDEMHAVVDFFE